MTTVAAPHSYGGRRSLAVPGVALLVTLGALLAGLVAGQLMAGGHAAVVPALALVVLPVFLWRKPEAGPILLLGAALVIEQFGYTVGPRAGAATAKIPLFHGMGGLHINPADLLLLLLLAICVAKAGTGATAPWPRSALSAALACLIGAVVVGIFVGKMHGGQIRFAFTETRPYVYLAATFVLASTLITTRRAVRGVLWALVLGVGLKAFQGLLIFLSIRRLSMRPEAVLAHEEALFFSLFLLLTIALWLFEVRGALRKVATALVPIVVAADLANTRRTAWLVLGVGVVALLAVTFAAVPTRRRAVGRIAIAIALAMSVYLPAYWNKSGGLAQPARAIHSAISPSPRDQLSDLYRVQEDANLLLNIRQAGPLGKGFGVPIDYALPIQDISSIDPFIAYIPHNGVFYVLMRMGPLGGIAFWAVLGLGIIGGCRLARSGEREAGVVGALTVAMLVAYAFEGRTDEGFFFYRVAFVVGTLLGVAEALRRLSPAPAATSTFERAPVAAPRTQPVPVPGPRPVPVAKRARSKPSIPESAGRRRARLAAAAGLPFAVGVFLWLLLAAPSHRTTSPVRIRGPQPLQAVAAGGLTELSADRGARPPAPAQAADVTLAIAPVDRGSWLQVRLGSATGRVVYEGVPAAGETVRFRARSLWARFGAAGNLAVTSNGKAVPLDGTVEAVFTAQGVSLR